MKHVCSHLLIALSITALAAACVDDEPVVTGDETIELTEDDVRNPDRRHRLAQAAAKVAARMPAEPLASDDPLDIAVSDSMQMTRAVCTELSDAETMPRDEIKGIVVDFVRGVADDGAYVSALADTVAQPDGPVVVSRSCAFKCLDEWKDCLDEFEIDDPHDPGDWAGSAICAITLEICWADCLLPG